jgi:hypothetical protein
MWPFTRTRAAPVTFPKVEPVIGLPGVEKRSSMSGYTSMLLGMREAYISGRSGLGELTSTVQGCVDLWQAGLGIAKVTGTDLLSHSVMAIVGRSLATRGESLWLIRGDKLVPCSDWDLNTVNGQPRAYRVSISEAGGGRSEVALAGEVMHFRIGVDSAAPWAGSSPLRRCSLTASMLHAIESALAETWDGMPFGSQIVPFPEAPDTDMATLGRSFRSQRGKVMLRESVAVTAAGGPQPASDWRPQDVTPGLEKAAPTQTLDAARNGICFAFGILPAMLNPQTTGQLVREGQRHLATWMLQPIAELLAEEASEKLGADIAIDLLTPLQAFDQGGSARAVATLVQAMTQAKEAGLDPALVAGAYAKMDWKD